MLSLYNYLSIASFLSSVGIGFIVIKNKPKEIITRTFFGITFFTALWILSNFLVDISPQFFPSSQLFLSRLTLLGPSFIPVTFLLLTIYFQNKNLNQAKWPLYIPAIILTLILPTKLNIENITFDRSGANYNLGYGYYLFLIYALVYVALATYNLMSLYQKERQTKKEQIKYILLGIVGSVIAGIILDIILPLFGNSRFVSLGPISTLWFLGLTAYAIVAHQLFDIRIIIRRTVVFTGLLTFALTVYGVIAFFFATVFGGNSGALNLHTIIPNIIASLLIATGYEPLRRWLQDRTDSFLFKKEYEQQAVISSLSKKLNDVIALDEALEIVMQTVVKVLHLRHAVTYVFQAGENGQPVIKRIKQIGYSANAHLFLDEKDLSLEYFNVHPNVITMDELERQIERNHTIVQRSEKNVHRGKITPELALLIHEHELQKAVHKKLTTLSSSLAIPLHLNKQPIGLILLSEKLSGDSFSPEDLALMETIGASAISSIQKAKLYEGDQMKSEFVSIASHELLTPISAIKGYLSMILQENMGKVDPQAREYLTKVYESSNRLSLLINDLLSVSRIESGRMKIEPQSLNIEKMILETIDQLQFMAKDKKLSLTYEKPAKPLPTVWADPDRTMQVLVNLVSNAIKYTPAGSITISAALCQKSMPHITVSVADTGLGMSKEAQSHLFEKFYRISTSETTGIMGTGLGLYITKSIMERMGGGIHVKSTEGKGSTFTISLPLFKVETLLPAL